jgi:thermitase
MSFRSFLALILGLLLFLPAPFTRTASAEEGYVPDELIVKMKDGSFGVTTTRSLRGLDRSTVERSFGELGMVVLRARGGISLEDLEAELLSDPNVEYVEKNYYVWADAVPNDPSYNKQTYLGRIGAPKAWDRTKGSTNVIIAVLDTGVESSHEDVGGKLIPGCNVLGSSTESSCGTNTEDVHGHGTGVAGTAAASTNNQKGAAGVCWNCPVLPVKVLADGGSGSVGDMIEGILFVRNYAIQNPSKRLIINLSLGRECNTSGPAKAEQDAINLAWESGVLIVAAAGNSGNNLRQCPASAANVIAVSATTSADTKASFSNYGNFIDIAAPGVGIYNAIGTANSPGSFYTSWSGTSFSSPVVSGVAGLVWSADTTLTNQEVEDILKDTAVTLVPSTYFGAGRVNADLAVTLASPASPTPTTAPTPRPTTPPGPAGNPTISLFDPGAAGVSNTISVTGVAPGARVGFNYATVGGSSTITSGACRGRTLELSRPASLGTAVADSSGKASLKVSLARTAAGRTLYMQALSESGAGCQITNRVKQTIKSSTGSSGGGSPSRGRTPARRPPGRF